ncbi:recombinase family protein [Phyllobacterium zundukense]|uniref:Resolvase/invertase-type recombinase catalytic domain-containing protein n=1 Tax=Phyllobacterium zundukense TaxID=1867719 RepID=A0A2N9W059_9HYPH|nr:recombinase family protein [Phyllobacterium zundukense]PIO45127.1 hypothetical protein B5P45_08770 [Phyllobacterium zundukense]
MCHRARCYRTRLISQRKHKYVTVTNAPCEQNIPLVVLATEQPIDTSTAAGKAFLDMLGVFAEFETNLRRERQMEGIQKAKVKGVYQGRKTSIDVDQVGALRDSGKGATEIARVLKIGRASVYRVLTDIA